MDGLERILIEEKGESMMGLSLAVQSAASILARTIRKKKMKKTFVLAGSFKEFVQHIKKIKQTNPIDVENLYVFVSNPEVLAGQRVHKVERVGTWAHRRDLYDIEQELIRCSIHIETAEVHDDTCESKDGKHTWVGGDPWRCYDCGVEAAGLVDELELTVQNEIRRLNG